MIATRHTQPDPAKLEETTAELKASLDRLELLSPVGEAEFFAALHGRLRQGALAYGDRSFSRDPGELLGELEQEALDLSGWSYVIWRRVRTLRAAVERAGLK